MHSNRRMEIPLTFFAAFFAALTTVNCQNRQSLTFKFDRDFSNFLPNTSDYYIAELRDLGLLMCVSRCVQQRPTCRGVFSNDVTGQCKLLNVPPLYAYDGAADFSPAWNTWQVDESGKTFTSRQKRSVVWCDSCLLSVYFRAIFSLVNEKYPI